MNIKTKHLRFSLRTLIILMTIVAMALGTWVATSRMRIRELESLREQGTIVHLVCNPPQLLQTIGISNTWPLFVEPFVIEIYVTPVVSGAKLGDTDTVIPVGDAKDRLLALKAEASRLGASDIHLILVGNPGTPEFSFEWLKFGIANFSVSTVENESRYHLRLAANRETGANINP